jgi:FAD:protein FMN transferase
MLIAQNESGTVFGEMNILLKLRYKLLLTFLMVVSACGQRPEQAAKDSQGDLLPTEVKEDEESSSLHIVNRSVAAMGTLFDLTVAVGPEHKDVDAAIEEGFAEIRRVDALMTTWQPDSYLSKVNARAGGETTKVPKELLDLIVEARRISELTHGKFDISFAAMGGLWKFKAKPPRLPDRQELKRRLPLVDYKSIIVDEENSTLRLARAGMRIGLGAIAKGYGVDMAAEALRKHGFNDFIVYGGGDLLVSGNKGGRLWKVGIQNPRERSRYFASFEIAEGGAVVTSGDYEKFFLLNGKRYHHIIDTDTGFPAEGTVSVTVLAKTAARADALATGIFVLGPKKGMEVIEADPSLEGIIVDSDLKVQVSTGLKKRVILRPITQEKEEHHE